MQVKLLRVLESGEYTPVGANMVKKANVRIIAATNQNLRERVKLHLIREDFFYRIYVLTITMPPLRETEGRSAAPYRSFPEGVWRGERLHNYTPSSYALALRLLLARQCA